MLNNAPDRVTNRVTVTKNFYVYRVSIRHVAILIGGLESRPPSLFFLEQLAGVVMVNTILQVMGYSSFA
jgi:hypothetical protein